MNDAPSSVRPARKSVSFGQVALGMMLVTVVALLVGVPYYLKNVRYERVAAFHLLPDTELAARVDLEHVLIFEPARRHLIPLANDLLPPQVPQTEPRLSRLERRTGLSLVRDVREVVVGRGPEPDQWLVVVGGKFPTGVVPALAETLSEEGTRWQMDSDVLSAPGGFSVGQASDGVLIFGPSRARVATALAPSDTQERMGLSQRGAVAVAAKGESLQRLAGHLGANSADFARLGRLERVTGELMLSAVPKGHLVLWLPAGSDVSVAESALSSAVKGWARTGGWVERSGEVSALRSASVSSPSAGMVDLTFSLSREGLDQGARSLGAWVRSGAPSR